MNKKNFKMFVIVAFAISFFAIIAASRTNTLSVSAADETTADVYKAKCAMCHSPKAEKAYNPEMPMPEQIDAILKGKKAEKPPNMPGFEAKGMTADQAKALAEHMKALRTPPATE